MDELKDLQNWLEKQKKVKNLSVLFYTDGFLLKKV